MRDTHLITMLNELKVFVDAVEKKEIVVSESKSFDSSFESETGILHAFSIGAQAFFEGISKQ